MSESEPTEIVIVRRRHGGHEDGHHGGVWKIAFADFMTAMMAFFLVLWIVNSTSKETKTAVARYFNPVKLAETTPARKGLQDPKEAEFEAAPDPKQKAEKEKQDTPSENKPKNEKSESAPPKSSDAGKSDKPAPTSSEKAAAMEGAKPAKAAAGKGGSPVAATELTMIEDPMATLDEIAGQLDGTQSSALMDGPADATADASARPTFKDPFEPIAPTILPRKNLKSEGLRGSLSQPQSASRKTDAAGDADTDVVPPVAADPNAPKSMVQQAQSVRQAVLSALKQQNLGKDAPKIDVAADSEGVLISLTDASGFSMFTSASAVPQPQTVKLLGEVGKRLRDLKGSIVLRGHTDSRPFKAGASDNWRLSSARAQTAFYMLVRGGLDEKRIERVEGYADRQPRNARNPTAPENRRIEILLRPEARP